MGIIPLYIGVELILGVAILNKAGGIYGVLSLLTGHPINFWQWLYNFLAIVLLPFYISALINLKDKFSNARKVSLACLIYVADTLVGMLYTFYFIHFWFSREDNNPTAVPGQDASGSKYPSQADSVVNDLGIDKRLDSARSVTGGASGSTLSSQSASPARELFLTISAIILVAIFRLYSTLVVISFTRALLKQDSNNQKYNNVTVDEDAEDSLKQKNSIISKIKLQIHYIEVKSKQILLEFFR